MTVWVTTIIFSHELIETDVRYKIFLIDKRKRLTFSWGPDFLEVWGFTLPFYYSVPALEWLGACDMRLCLSPESFQSAYKRYHSSETALLRVQNDILRSIDNGENVVLVLLDLSAAFDTVNHETLLSRLSTRYGFCGSVLKWFTSYLTNRTQFVDINGTFSTRGNVISELVCLKARC